MSADVVGIDALRRIEEDGAQLVGLLQYLQFELDTLKRKRFNHVARHGDVMTALHARLAIARRSSCSALPATSLPRSSRRRQRST